MIRLTWRQLRVGALSVFAAVFVTAVVLLVAAHPTGHIDLDSTGPLFSVGALVVYALPAVIGVFWGVPTVTRELENGTHNLVWNQTVTRNRWLAAKLGVGVLAAMSVAGLLSLVVSWWAAPVDALGSERFSGGSFPLRMEPLLFGARGIVPIGYAVFAFVLGVAIGMLLRRTVPAMAVTLVLFAAVQVAVPLFARPHVLPATEETVAITASNIWQIRADEDGVLESLTVAEPAGAWVLANETVDQAGNTVSPLPAAVRGCLPPPPGEYDEVPSRRSIAECVSDLSGLGYRQHLSYQPAARLTGWKRWLVVAGMEHASFTDVGVVGEQLGLDLGADIEAGRGAAITRAYVRAFFDLHLRGEPQPLLDRPSPSYPEVSFADPAAG